MENWHMSLYSDLGINFLPKGKSCTKSKFTALQSCIGERVAGTVAGRLNNN